MSTNKLPSQINDFPAWYNEVVKRADLAEHGPAKGSMIIKPHGYAIWELTQRALDDRFKATGHENLYFPLLIPMSLLQQEADHVEGFAPQVAVVTHGGGQKLEEPLAVRPTSEAIIWSTYKRWIQSYRDLPLLYNQWSNIVRWEMRTRLFLRTSEFLWQEGHTAHATSAEAREEALRMLEVYREVAEDVLAIPVHKGRKSAGERFPGAVETYPIEGLMLDGKALQCGTSHFLGQNFGKAYDVTFINAEGISEHAWGTSWGFTTRMIGGTIMAHGDDAGLRLPPAVAPIQVAIVPIHRSDDERAAVLSVAEKLRSDLAAAGIRVRLDDREQHRPGYKFAEWELKGVPVRIELGPRDVAADRVVIASRLGGDKEEVAIANVAAGMAARLASVQQALFADALAYRDANTHEITSFDAFATGLEAEGGFWVGAWCGDGACEAEISTKTKATIRFLPIEPTDPDAVCMHCGKPGVDVATWARAY
ncbi:MAG: proline--tRNA ligase [Chloroflexota bacterium]|nr:proline--tRNA ligase [Chloroflexota bacterium]